MRTSIGRLNAGLKAATSKCQPPILPRSAGTRCHAVQALASYSSTAGNSVSLRIERQNEPDKSDSSPEPPERQSESNFVRFTWAHEKDDKYSVITQWSLELERRYRTERAHGVRQQWEVLKRQRLQLPTRGPLADLVWSTLLEAGSFRWLELYEHFIHLRESTGRTYERFYSLLVGKCLLMTTEWKDSGRKAFWWHTRFESHDAIPEHGLRWMVKEATYTRDSLQAFEDIYKHSKKGHCIYDALMTALLRKREWHVEAVRWHDILLKHRDHPSEIWNTPKMQHLERIRRSIGISDSRRVPLTSAIPDSISRYFGQPPAIDASSGRYKEERKSALPFDRADVSAFMGKTLANTTPRELSDEFCARVFATTAFSLDAIIKGLAFLGTSRIGPLALREMAIRASGPEVVVEKLDALRSAGINLKDCTFSKAVVKFATEKRADLLRSLLESDQHPDVLDDAEVQRRLLHQYIRGALWIDAHRTMYLLTMFHDAPEREAWNLILRHYALPRDLRMMATLCEDMVKHKIGITATSLDVIAVRCLKKRRPGRGPNTYNRPYTQLRHLFVTNLWLRLSEMGMSLHPQRWHEILRRFGMTGKDFSRIEGICLRLVELYKRSLVRWTPIMRNGPHPAIAHPLNDRIQNDLGRLFTPALQAAIVSWGFKQGMNDLVQRYYRALKEKRQGRFGEWTQWGHRDELISRLQGEKRVYFRNSSNLLSDHIELPPSEKTFLRGLLLLRKLSEQGVQIDIHVIRRTIKHRLWQLFSVNKSDRGANRQAFMACPYKLEEMVWAIEKAWIGPPLFPKLREQNDTELCSITTSCTDKSMTNDPSVPHEQSSPEYRPSPIKGKVEEPFSLPSEDEFIPSTNASQTNADSTSQFIVSRAASTQSQRPSQGNGQIKVDDAAALKRLAVASTQGDQKEANTTLSQAGKRHGASTALARSTMDSSPPLPPMLQGLVEIVDADKFWPTLSSEERIRKRKELHFTLFGRRPKFGQRRGRANEALWARWVDGWARRYEVEIPNVEGQVGTKDPFEAHAEALALDAQRYAYRIATASRESREREEDAEQALLSKRTVNSLAREMSTIKSSTGASNASSEDLAWLQRHQVPG